MHFGRYMEDISDNIAIDIPVVYLFACRNINKSVRVTDTIIKLILLNL